MIHSIIRVGNIVVKELIQFRRDWLLVLFILLAPVLQLILMSRTVEEGVTHQPVAIFDQDHSRLSRELAMRLDNAEDLNVRFRVDSSLGMRDLLDQGRVRLAVVIPAGFAEGLSAIGKPQQIQLIADGSQDRAAAVVLGAATNVLQDFAADLVARRGLLVPEVIDFRTDVRFNPTIDYRIFLIPAQVGFIIYQVTLMVAALGLARERELGTLEQLMVTPMRRTELSIGKGLPAAAVGGLNSLTMLLLSVTVFQVPMRGSVLLLAFLTLLFIAAVVGWGLVLSALARTQQQAILFVFILAMVEIALSGFMVPTENMPTALQIVSRLAPLQHYLIIIRSIMLKGAGLRELWPHAAALLGLTLFMGLVGVRLVVRQLD